MTAHPLVASPHWDETDGHGPAPGTSHLTVGLSVLAHGLSAAPLANRYARWYEQHPRDKVAPMESAPTDVTRFRGPVARSAELT